MTRSVRPILPLDAGIARPALQSWRITTAVRVFATAVVAGTALGGGVLVESAPSLVVLAVVACAASLLEWMTRDHPTHWYVVAESVVVTVLVVATESTAALGAYLAVPLIAAGVRHGAITTLNVTLVSALTLGSTIAADPEDGTLAQLAEALLWLSIGLGVGMLASWQSRSTRTLVARQAPHTAAHQLMERVHELVSSGRLGLDTASLALDLDSAMRGATGCARSTTFLLDTDGTVRALNGGEDTERLAREIGLPRTERTPGAAVVPLRGARQALGHCVLVGVPRWTHELDERALEVADEFAVRLDTAMLFDDVRALAMSDERNRIAREMHDGVAQEIVGLGFLVDEIESVSEQTETRELAATLRGEITRLVSEIRFSIFDLRHESSDGRLAASLADYTREVSDATGLRVHVSLSESGPPLPPRHATQVLRVAQEAIGNVRKHARAANLWVTLDSDGTSLHLRIADDGVGNAGPRDRHWGLQGMRERADGVGATLEVAPRPGGGTVVTLCSRTTSPHEGDNAHEHHRAAGR